MILGFHLTGGMGNSFSPDVCLVAAVSILYHFDV